MGYGFHSSKFDYSYEDYYDGFLADEMEMGFLSNAAERFKCTSLHKWMLYADLHDWLDILTSTKFLDANSRNSAANTFRGLKRERDIFNMNKRFPDEFYVCLGNHKISDIILAIMSSLDKDEDSSRNELDNCYKVFIGAVKTLNNKVFCSTKYEDLVPYGVFTRESFERHYNLMWR